MTTEQIDNLVRLLAGRMPTLLRYEFGKLDVCIAGARAVLHVCAGLGVPAEPLACTCNVFNAQLVDLMTTWQDQHGAQVPADVMLRWQQGEYDSTGAWAVGIGHGDDVTDAPEGYRKWAGHLVALVDRRWLVDVTLGQATRPHRNVNLPDGMAVEVTPDFLAATQPLPLQLQNGTVVQYVHTPENLRYFGPDWHMTQPDFRPVRRCLQAARMLLAQQGVA